MSRSEGKAVACLGKVYDIFAQSISILDVTTDIIVCIEFYQFGRKTFFIISLCILILALFGYIMAFINKFSDEYLMRKQLGLFLTLIPISPFIPFIFYYVDDDTSWLATFLENHWCYNISFYGSSASANASRFKQFFESKVDKHLGFILESLVEAFPQAILQMTAIVMYDETNIVSIISILISLLSVASKSLVFSFGASSNFKQLAFNWLCAVTDFFGIFFVVCWVFYEPVDPDLNDAFITIQNIWLYKLCIFLFPMIAFVSVTLHLLAVSVIVYDNGTGICEKMCFGFMGLFLVTFAWICGLIASVLVLEITTWTWIAGSFLFLGSSRLPTYHKLSLQFWWTIISWVNSAKKHHIGSKYKGCTSHTKHQDKMMRLASVNYITGKDKTFCFDDDIFMSYLEKEKNENQYMKVTFLGLRMNTANKKQSELLQKFWKWYSTIWRDEARDPCNRICRTVCNNRTCPADKHDCCLDAFFAASMGSLTFIFGPWYFISRVISLLFPAFIVLYLYFGYNVNIWNTDSIHMFQIVMISIYIVLCAILSVLLYFNAKEQYLMAHLLPSKKKIHQLGNNEKDMELKIKEITNHYYGITVIPIRRAIIIDRFGKDLGLIIVSYLPTDDDFEDVEHVVRVKAVV